MSRPKDWTDKSYGKLTFIERTNETIAHCGYIWRLKCECGNDQVFFPAHKVVSGRYENCGCEPYIRPTIMKDRAGQKYNHLTFIKPLPEKRNSGGAIILQLSQQECFYCGRLPSDSSFYTYKYGANKSQTLIFRYNGLDRIDSDHGHTVDNVRTSCKQCNQAKNDLTEEEFFSLIRSIYSRHCK